MSWQIVEVEVTEAPARLATADEGIAVVLRHRGYPVGFVMHESGTARHEPSVELRSLLDASTAARILLRAASEELPQAPAAVERPTVSVAVCTRDRPQQLERCLESLQPLVPAAGRETAGFEIIVVDNAPSDDRTREVASRFAGVRYLREPTPGLNFARNTALEQASGELLAYLDDDVVVDRGWLSGLVGAWRASPQAGFFTGQVLPLELATPAQVAFEWRGGFRRGFEREYFGETRDNDRYYPCGAGVFGTGANMAVNRRALLELGGFDVALDTGRPLPGGGDLDAFYRLIRAGHGALYEPPYLVFHQHRREISELRRQYRDSWGKSFVAFAVKSWKSDPPMRARWRALLAWWFGKQTTDLFQSALGRVSRSPSLILSELLGGIVGLAGEYDRSRRRARRLR
jgi:glycosyltransferase involved in cell wall biosynthesis